MSSMLADNITAHLFVVLSYIMAASLYGELQPESTNHPT
jgi:ABC-type multidrug transport system permease subunit